MYTYLSFPCRPQSSCTRRMLHHISFLIKWVSFSFSSSLRFTAYWILLIIASFFTDVLWQSALSQPSASIIKCLQYWTGLRFLSYWMNISWLIVFKISNSLSKDFSDASLYSVSQMNLDGQIGFCVQLNAWISICRMNEVT